MSTDAALERKRAQRRAYYARHKERIAAQMRDNYLENRDQYAARRLRTRYGLTPEQYEQLLAEQDGRCAICREECALGRRLSVDHDHSCCPGKSCGKCVRGLLCSACNTAIGKLQDDPALLRTAAEYLERSRGR